MKKLFCIAVFMLLCVPMFAQKGGDQKISRDEIKSLKIAFFTDRLQLTPEESQKFWPIYNKYWDEIRTVAHRKRDLLRKINEVGANNALAKTYLDDYKSLIQKDASINENYIAQFEKLLPSYKVALIFVADEEFRRDLLKKMRNKQN